MTISITYGKTPESKEELERLLKLLNTPIGRALRKPGATLRRWKNSSPANVWMETARGPYLEYPPQDGALSVREFFAQAHPYLNRLDRPNPQGEMVYFIPDGLVAALKEKNMNTRLPKPSKSTAPKRSPRL